MSPIKYYSVSNCSLQEGGELPQARLAYRTVGALNSARDNAVVVTTGFSGTDTNTEAALVGKDRALNPEKYFIILPNLFGGGRSSSPSNTCAPFERRRFPHITIYDNVRMQHLLVTEELRLQSLRLVTGISMGAAQAFEWGAQFPDMMKSICPIVGAARTASYNKIFLYSLQRALTLDAAFEDGYYTRPPLNGLRVFATIYAGWGFSEPAYREEIYRSFGASNHEEWVERFWEPHFINCDVNDLLSQLWTWTHADISANKLYNGDFEAALAAIKARTLILPVDCDRYFPPVDSEYEARHIPNCECRTIHSIWGHYMPANPDDRPALDAALKELLEA